MPEEGSARTGRRISHFVPHVLRNGTPTLSLVTDFGLPAPATLSPGTGALTEKPRCMYLSEVLFSPQPTDILNPQTHHHYSHHTFTNTIPAQ